MAGVGTVQNQRAFVRRQVVVFVTSVASVVHASFPRLSVRVRALVDAMLLSGGPIGPAHRVAYHLGLRNRFDLARLLKREGLPPLHDLAAWVSVLEWLARAEREGCSLCHLAFRMRRDPAVCYRTVKRVTGLRWGEVKGHHVSWLVERFIRHCQCSATEGASHVDFPAREGERC